MEESPRGRRKRAHPSSPSPPSPISKKPQTFPSFQDIPNLPSNIKSLCHLIATTSAATVEHSLQSAAISVIPHDVEEVLKLSYGCQSVKFFRWSGRHLNDNHTPYSWNLVVDILGRNRFFDPMWDAVKSMNKEGLLSLATFASVFSSYVAADRIREAIMAFEIMDNYGCVRDAFALNSLLSAICSNGRTLDACDYLQVAKKFVRPDTDTYAILMEGWEGEKSMVSAKETFAEMVIEIGWDPANVPAYDSFLCTLVRGHDGLLEAIKFVDSMRDRRCYPGVRFLKAALDECVKCHDVRTAEFFWEVLVVGKVLQPTSEMYNLMIGLCCYRGDTDAARRMLHEMVYQGAFPDVVTYNLLFKFLLKGRKLREASSVFAEMVQNECVPEQDNCDLAVKVYVDCGEPVMAIKVWKCLVENYKKGLEQTANFLVVGLCNLNRPQVAVKYAEDMIGRGISLSSSTLSKLRQSLVKERREYVYEDLLRKWKSH
ncbi:Pentatricopeptide repeat-containing protein, mitochondrial [Glycine soja]|uniref:Pentatricopeptide repeat-containing protein, mitochondrial n=1 Tax=Glycine soja TaxID=3848 RepID=A0A445HGQ1_GLYSO|nr:Pentatricopeptide repeat-containing protein, mitochondrial [Glycine soja]RZB72800.1 Pentatricopeptide repeat-containing protein, mitochondrial [Glycine soja]